MFATPETGLIGVGILFVLLVWGVPIGAALGVVGIGGLALVLGSEPALIKSGVVVIETLTRYELGTLPLFLLMAQLFFSAGWSNMLPDIVDKSIEFLRAFKPKLSHLAMLFDAGNPGKALEVKLLTQTAARLGLTLRAKGLRSAADVDAAFTQITLERTDALIVLVDGITRGHTRQIVDFAAKQRLPAIYQIREFVDAGGLMSYGLNVRKQFERTAEYMHRIFQGVKPSELPVEQPTRFELVINGKAAKALGLAIPYELVLRAEQVIE